MRCHPRPTRPIGPPGGAAPRTVLITGGSSGIGAAMVRAFAAAGYRVCFTYCTGKAALAHLGRHLQARYPREPIDVFTLCPGATDTPMFAASTLSGLDGEGRRKLVDSLPGRRLIQPTEIARLAVWLCTEEARVLRGAVLDAPLGLGAHPGILAGGGE